MSPVFGAASDPLQGFGSSTQSRLAVGAPALRAYLAEGEFSPVGWRNLCLRDFKRLQKLLPLLLGEGRGEGNFGSANFRGIRIHESQKQPRKNAEKKKLACFLAILRSLVAILRFWH
jgi:hypothetical protein